MLTSVRSCWGRGLPWLLVWTGPRSCVMGVLKSNGFEKNLEKNLFVVPMRCVSYRSGTWNLYTFALPEDRERYDCRAMRQSGRCRRRRGGLSSLTCTQGNVGVVLMSRSESDFDNLSGFKIKCEEDCKRNICSCCTKRERVRMCHPC